MKKVAVFIHTEDGKSGRGTLDFFDDQKFQKFLAGGGSITIRYEGGDIGLFVEPVKPEDGTDRDV